MLPVGSSISGILPPRLLTARPILELKFSGLGLSPTPAGSAGASPPSCTWWPGSASLPTNSSTSQPGNAKQPAVPSQYKTMRQVTATHAGVPATNAHKTTQINAPFAQPTSSTTWQQVGIASASRDTSTSTQHASCVLMGRLAVSNAHTMMELGVLCCSIVPILYVWSAIPRLTISLMESNANFARWATALTARVWPGAPYVKTDMIFQIFRPALSAQSRGVLTACPQTPTNVQFATRP